jgi:hypothetical protein
MSQVARPERAIQTHEIIAAAAAMIDGGGLESLGDDTSAEQGCDATADPAAPAR